MQLGHVEFDERVRSQTNSLILGSIGYGKSKFLEYLMRQDLKRRQPFCLIDFHGSLFENVKAWCAFNGYYDRRLVLVDLSGGRFLKGCGFFRRQAGLDVGVQSSGMVDSVLRVSGLQSPDSYPVIYKLSKILFTALIEKDIPLNQGFQLFANREAFSGVVSELSDPLVRALWSDLENLTQSEWSRQVTPTINKLYRLVQSKAIERALCVNKPGYNLELTFRDTILVNLATSGELDSDAARVFAALFINHFYHSAKRRIGRSGKNPSPYYLYIDEWWLTPTPDIGRILAETRKFGLLLVLANQDLSQIKASFGAEFAQSLLTLCQVQCCFGGLNFTDASRLAHEWGVEPQAVQALAERQCLVKLPRLPVSSITVPDVREPFVRPERMLEFERRIAEQTGALPVQEVDALLAGTTKQPQRKRADDTIDGYAVV